MDRRFHTTSYPEDSEQHVSGNGPDSPSSGDDMNKTTSFEEPSPKKRRELCQCRLVTWRDLRTKERRIHRPIRGPGGSTAKSPSRDLLIPDALPAKAPEGAIAVFSGQAELVSDGSASLLSGCGYRHQWFDDDDVVSTAVVLESPFMERDGTYMDDDFSMAFSSVVSGEDESLFADLGELPECSVVFRRRIVEPEDQNRRCSLSAVPCCGSTG
uniref:Uncharacterized protein n=1 Tax=Cannabis sativa TaxID=3483 RepID=A0A803QJ90_CANSA